MNFLIIGANGYTGSNLCRSYLSNGHSVSVLLSNRVSVNNLTSMISKGLSVLGPLHSWVEDPEHNFDGVISLVGFPINDHQFGNIEALVSGQLTAQAQALEIGRNHNCPVVIAGSYWETIRTINDSYLNLYSALSAAMGTVTEFFHREYGVATARVLLADTYGPFDWRQKLIPMLLSSRADSEPLALGSPNQMMAPIFISDVVVGIQLALEALQGGSKAISIYQLFPDSLEDVSSVVKNAEKTLNRQIPLNWNHRVLSRHEVQHIEQAFLPPPGWSQKVQFSEGLSLSALPGSSLPI